MYFQTQQEYLFYANVDGVLLIMKAIWYLKEAKKPAGFRDQ